MADDLNLDAIKARLERIGNSTSWPLPRERRNRTTDALERLAGVDAPALLDLVASLQAENDRLSADLKQSNHRLHRFFFHKEWGTESSKGKATYVWWPSQEFAEEVAARRGTRLVWRGQFTGPVEFVEVEDVATDA